MTLKEVMEQAALEQTRHQAVQGWRWVYDDAGRPVGQETLTTQERRDVLWALVMELEAL